MNLFKNHTHSKMSAERTLEQQMIVAALMWLIVAGLCVVAANAWAMGV